MNYQKIIWFIKTMFLRLKIGHIGLVTYVGPPMFIYGGRRIYIGNRVRIFPGSRMETHNNGSIYIEENVSIGQNFHLTSGEQVLKIGKNTTILGNCFITNIDHDFTEIGIHILQQPQIVRKTEIGENCFIGYGAAIQAGTTLGKQCIVGAHSVVRGSFPDYCVIVGAPGRVVKKYNLETSTWERV